MDHYGRVFVARLKGDEWIYYFTDPRMGPVEETFVAFAEIPEAEYPELVHEHGDDAGMENN
jgi:hypothetical protein